MKVTYFFLLAIFLFLFSACSENAEPVESVTHPLGWNEQGTSNFHGNKVLQLGSDFCTSCHGDDYSGGESGISCASCHADYPHPAEWTTSGNNLSHAAYIKNSNWSMERCKTCHGVNYTGGSSGVSCLKCHNQTGGPEACNTCHGSGAGSVSDLSNWAPPEDLDNNSETTTPGVGAHQSHLKNTSRSTAYAQDCQMCHVDINQFGDSNHINGIVNIEFAPIATNWGKLTPVYNSNTYKCSDVYCHGNFALRRDESVNQNMYSDSVMTGNNPVMDWTVVGKGLSACGTCHGLPPKGHVLRPDCSSCHYTVVDENNIIIDKDKHINGFVDVY